MIARIKESRPSWAKVLYLSPRLQRRLSDVRFAMPVKISPILRGQSFAWGEHP